MHRALILALALAATTDGPTISVGGKGLSANGSPALRVDFFNVSTDFSLARVSQRPTCVGDFHCVLLLTPEVAADGGVEWIGTRGDGGTATVTQGTGATYLPSAAHSPDGGWFLSQSYIDDTSTSAAIPRVSDAAVRAAFAGDHTIIASGYGGRVVNSNGGWWTMITDGTNSMQMRAGGSQFEFIENGMGSAETTSGTCVDGWCVAALRRSGTTVTGRTEGTNGGGISGSTMGAVTGANAFYFGGGTGGCCTPGGGLGGPLAWVAIYDENKSDAWVVQTEKNWFGAPFVQSGGNGNTGTTIGRPMGRDDVEDSGYVNVFTKGAYITDPLQGIFFMAATQNWFVQTDGGNDALSASDLGGAAVSTANKSSGPFSRWRNVPEGDWLASVDAGLAWEQSARVVNGADGGAAPSWYNCSAYISAGDSGTVRDSATFAFVHNGTLDGGSAICAVSGLTGRPRRYPLNDGCWAYIANASSLQCRIYPGNDAGQTGSITIYQRQLTDSIFPNFPMLNGTGSGANWVELDAGDVPYGNTAGKVEAVFPMQWSTSQLGPDYLGHVGPSLYVFDIYGVGASHDVLADISVDQTYDGGTFGVPDIQALMYGGSSSYENRFDVGPVQFVARTFYVWSYEWVTDTGALPDGGTGVGCRGKTRIDVCSNPDTCHATTVVGSNSPPIPSSPLLPFGQNSGNLGTCPAQSTIADLGTRIAGTSPTTGWVTRLRIYHH